MRKSEEGSRVIKRTQAKSAKKAPENAVWRKYHVTSKKRLRIGREAPCKKG